MAIKLGKWDSAEHLKTEEEMQAYLQACIEESNGDAAFIAKALGNIAKAKGMAQLSRDTGLGRERKKKKKKGDVNPRIDTVIKVVKALNLRLVI